MTSLLISIFDFSQQIMGRWNNGQSLMSLCAATLLSIVSTGPLSINLDT